MEPLLEALFQKALSLSPDQRIDLAQRLVESVDSQSQPAVEAAWEAEIARRIDRFKRGESKPIPASEVFARLKEIAPEP
jgi:putative addiction module component (TIGR02574 family)